MQKQKLVGVLLIWPSTIVQWVGELIGPCLELSPAVRPAFKDIFEILKSHNFDLFNETTPLKPPIQQLKSKEKNQTPNSQDRSLQLSASTLASSILYNNFSMKLN